VAAPELTLDRSGDGSAGSLHQGSAGLSAPNGSLIGLRHLDRGEQGAPAAKTADQAGVEGRNVRVGQGHRRDPFSFHPLVS
jgi:hypothetical protein